MTGGVLSTLETMAQAQRITSRATVLISIDMYPQCCAEYAVVCPVSYATGGQPPALRCGAVVRPVRSQVELVQAVTSLGSGAEVMALVDKLPEVWRWACSTSSS